MHEIQSEDKKNADIAIDNVRIDKLTDMYLVEIKKSDADIEAVRWQVLLYLKKLKDKGIIRKGKIEFHEQNKQDNKVLYEELTEQSEHELASILNTIDMMIQNDSAPDIRITQKCKKCSYYEYCAI